MNKYYIVNQNLKESKIKLSKEYFQATTGQGQKISSNTTFRFHAAYEPKV